MRVLPALRYFAYWGKARPEEGAGAAYHLLAFHSLDVAACGAALLRSPRFSLRPLADELGWPLPLVERLAIFFWALHDLGKFARAFQNLAPDLGPALVPPDRRKCYTERHDTLGWLLWRDFLAQVFPETRQPDDEGEFWALWIGTAVGHHGTPPRDTAAGGSLPLRAKDYFLPDDVQAAAAFVAEIAALLLPESMPSPTQAQLQTLRRHSWRLAGLAVLADWLGSNQDWFPYDRQPRPLSTYWAGADGAAVRAVAASGLAAAEAAPWRGPLALFDYLQPPTPLQVYAAEVSFGPGPQLFLLEDVTGAGKTEAALILAHRLMAAGRARGLYFALPSMATANQMYERVGRAYRRLFADTATPSLVLAHSARQLVEGFRASVLPARQPADIDYGRHETSATAQCSAWLANSHKAALLADLGVGTLDQVLLATLPVRHQVLRLLGLAGKVLVVDEVHAYDDYMRTLLKELLTAHAAQGGSALLLSATLPASLRVELAAAFQRGRGDAPQPIAAETRYPLATQVHATVSTQTCATRQQLRRRVQVAPLYSEQAALELVACEALAGRCVCWIRNTVEDARRAYAALRERLPDQPALLFHSRFAMGDRLVIEGRVLSRFGKHSSAASRRGQILIGTQVLEQSLDFDADVMISDLAPIDLLIQRAGRLQRHARRADGDPAADGIERRSPPVFYVFGPEPTERPAGDWYARVFPGACFVYPDSGRLWLTQRALLAAGCIVSPGESGEPGAVRTLVEAVYGEAAPEVPPALLDATREQEGKALADISLARFNALALDEGYNAQSSLRWFDESQVPTRLGDDSLTIYLARAEEGALRPLLDAAHFPWEQSAVRIGDHKLQALAPAWRARFDAAIQTLRERHRLLAAPAWILPLERGPDGVWFGLCEGRSGELRVTYDMELGLGLVL